MHSNGTLPLDMPLDARCGYAFIDIIDFPIHPVTRKNELQPQNRLIWSIRVVPQPSADADTRCKHTLIYPQCKHTCKEPNDKKPQVTVFF